jgi:hypothetical protein
MAAVPLRYSPIPSCSPTLYERAATGCLKDDEVKG